MTSLDEIAFARGDAVLAVAAPIAPSNATTLAVIRLLRPTRIEPDELRRWAHDIDPSPPSNADPNVWDLMLVEWFADDRLYTELASSDDCPKRRVFLALLQQRLQRRCAQTRWLTETVDDVLVGIHPSRWTRKAKGGGVKEKTRLRSAFARDVAEAAESEARLHAETLLRLARPSTHADLRELASRLERFLADPRTIADAYWNGAT